MAAFYRDKEKEGTGERTRAQRKLAFRKQRQLDMFATRDLLSTNSRGPSNNGPDTRHQVKEKENEMGKENKRR